MLHGARWLLNKDIVRGANSYPLKGVPRRREQNARHPLSISPRQGKRANKDQGYDVDKRRNGIGDYRRPGLQRARSLRSKRFSSRARGYGRGERRAGKEDRGIADAVVEGDGKGGVVVIGSKEDTY